MMNNYVDKTALITGANGGLGLAVARQLYAAGWQLVLADVQHTNLEVLDQFTRCFLLRLDVTCAKSVQQAKVMVQARYTQLDAILNFAGVLQLGSMVEIDEAALQQLLDINVLGTYRVNKAFLPLLLENQGAPKIINVSSETGWQEAGPFNGAYSMSKHAIEAYSDALRKELANLNIAVVKIQPGPFKGNMVASIDAKFSQAVEHSSLFKKQLKRLKKAAIREQHKASDPEILARTVAAILAERAPKPAYSIRPDKMRVALHYLPVAISDRVYKRFLK